MSVDIFGIVRDALVISYMFVLRIGVPILITLMLGAWLRRLLEEREEKPARAPVQLKLGQHCWDVVHSAETDQIQSAAAEHPDLPCWLALQVTGQGVQEICHTCPHYAAEAPVVARA
jgi:hypothetical protein